MFLYCYGFKNLWFWFNLEPASFHYLSCGTVQSSPSKYEHGHQYGHQLKLVLGQQGGHDDEVEDVEEEQLQARRDEHALHRLSSGCRLLQVKGAGAELAHGSQEHHCEGGVGVGGGEMTSAKDLGFRLSALLLCHCLYLNISTHGR